MMKHLTMMMLVMVDVIAVDILDYAVQNNHLPVMYCRGQRYQWHFDHRHLLFDLTLAMVLNM